MAVLAAYSVNSSTPITKLINNLLQLKAYVNIAIYKGYGTTMSAPCQVETWTIICREINDLQSFESRLREEWINNMRWTDMIRNKTALEKIKLLNVKLGKKIIKVY